MAGIGIQKIAMAAVIAVGGLSTLHLDQAVAQDTASQGNAGAQDNLRETHGDWEIRCTTDNQCYMSQIAYSTEGRPVMHISIRKLPEPQKTDNNTLIAVNSITTPLRVMLGAGIGLKIDGTQAGRAPYTFCHEGGCVSSTPLSDTIVNALKAGGKAEFLVRTMQAGDQAAQTMAISLSGFTAAYDAL